MLRTFPRTRGLIRGQFYILLARAKEKALRHFDREVVIVQEARTKFSELQAELAAGRQGRLVYYARYLLWRGGDLRRLPQVERKQMLRDLLSENAIEPPVQYSEQLIGRGQKMFEHTTKLTGKASSPNGLARPIDQIAKRTG